MSFPETKVLPYNQQAAAIEKALAEKATHPAEKSQDDALSVVERAQAAVNGLFALFLTVASVPLLQIYRIPFTALNLMSDGYNLLKGAEKAIFQMITPSFFDSISLE